MVTRKLLLMMAGGCVVLAGCVSTPNVLSEMTPQPTPERTATQPADLMQDTETAIPTSTPTTAATAPPATPTVPPPTPTLTVTPSIPAEARLEIACIPLQESPPPGSQREGGLLLEDRTEISFNRFSPSTFLVDMQSLEEEQIALPGENLVDLVVSPNHQQFAAESIFLDDHDNLIEDNLVVFSADGQRELTLPWQDSWYRIVAWLNEQNLVILAKNPDAQENEPQSILILYNILTQQSRPLPHRFPDLYDWPPLPQFDRWGLTIFEPTLTRVAYLALLDSDKIMAWVMWDLENNTALAQPSVALFPMPR